MAAILWHRRETRRQTENTNFSLHDRATSRLYHAPRFGAGTGPRPRQGQKRPGAGIPHPYRIYVDRANDANHVVKREKIAVALVSGQTSPTVWQPSPVLSRISRAADKRFSSSPGPGRRLADMDSWKQDSQ